MVMKIAIKFLRCDSKKFYETRGPRGPLIAHLRNKSKVIVGPLYRGRLYDVAKNIKALDLVDFYKKIFLRFPYITLCKSDKPPGRAPFHPRGIL